MTRGGHRHLLRRGRPSSAHADAVRPSPARAEPHDETTWLPLPDVDALPTIDDLLAPDAAAAPAPVREAPVVQPSPARAEPHDETTWLPLPAIDDLPEINELAEGATPRRRRRRLHLVLPGRRPLAVAVSVTLLAGAVYAAALELDTDVDVRVRADGAVIEAESSATDVAALLSEHNVALGPDDVVVPNVATPLENDMRVTVYRAFPVSVDLDGEVTTHNTTLRRPRDFIAQLAIEEDVAMRDAPDRLRSGASVLLRTRKLGTLNVDGQSINYHRPVLTVGELLDDYEVVLGPQDMTDPGVNEVIPESNAFVTVTRVATETDVAIEPYTRPDERRADANLAIGETRVVEGEPGTQTVTYQIIRHDDREFERIPISKVPIDEASPTITFYGTKANPLWDKMAQCETGGRWDAPGPTYQGGLGIYYVNWNHYGGRQFAPTAGRATREEQIIVAERIRREHGWHAWGCAEAIGL